LEDRVYLLLLVYTILSATSNAVLSLLGESRVDLYLSLNILAYYFSYAIIHPPMASKRAVLLNILLFMLFTAIVAYRVYEVLSG
jgi:hypothetical protein